MTRASQPQTVPLNDLSRGWLAGSSAVEDSIRRVVRSGRFVLGPEVVAFEDELAEFIGSAEAVGVASGTDALALAIQACGAEPGDEVVVPANAGGYATVAAIGIGCTVALADVDSNTGLVTMDTVQAALGPRTRVVVVTHLYGNVADVSGIRARCDAKGISVVEDCAQAIGGRDHSRRVGSIGRAAAFSFYPTKNLGAIGDGGAVITSDPTVAQHVRRLRQYGWSERYDAQSRRGRNSRLDELQAAVLRVGLHLVDGFNRTRVEIVARYADALEHGPARMVTGASGSTVAHLAVVRAPDRDAARKRLAALGIATDVHYPLPDHRQSGFRHAIRATPVPQAEHLADHVFTVPCFADLRADEVDRVESALGSIFK